MSNQPFQSNFQWNLYDTAGRNSLSGNFLKSWKNEKEEEFFLTQLIINSYWLDRSIPEISFDKLEKDFEVQISQLAIHRSSLEEMVTKFESWLNSPSPFSINLCAENKDQYFEIAVGSPKIPTSLGHGLVSLKYAGVSFVFGEWNFVVDQSCIRIFLDQINDGRQKFINLNS